jgi:hypothetical protein
MDAPSAHCVAENISFIFTIPLRKKRGPKKEGGKRETGRLKKKKRHITSESERETGERGEKKN